MERLVRNPWLGRVIGLLLAIIGIGFILVGYWAIRPYDMVRVSPEDAVTTPPVVEQGDTVMVTRASFCNDGVDLAVHRWADSMVDGKPVASFDLGTIVFFSDGEPACFEPSVTGVTLPNYVIGPDGGPGAFRLRFDISYRPNPVRTITISSTTTEFVVVPATPCPDSTLVSDPPCTVE
jgi:hypothetical protein